MVTLDVGCGHRACGDVNVDLYPEETFHRLAEDKTRIKCKTHLIPNFVRADAQHLPFRDNSFDEVNCNHVLEHITNPVQMIREMLRVTKDRVQITVPHRFGKGARLNCHINFFNNKWFAQVLERFPEVYSWSIEQTTREFPFNLFNIPNQITVSFRKGDQA